MDNLTRLMNTLRFGYQEQKIHYFTGAARKTEFILYIVLYIILTVLLIICPQPYQAMFSTLQPFVLFFIAFRFGYFGLIVALFLGLRDFVILINIYLNSYDMYYAIGLVAKIFAFLSTIFIAVLTDKKENQQKKLRELVITDDLTGVYNQRFFYQTLEQTVQKAQATGDTVGLIMVDIDDFKEFNELFGHEYGNLVLEQTGYLLKQISGDKYVVCRYGGDEFSLILPGADIDSLNDTAQFIRQEFDKASGNSFKPGLNRKVTISLGLSLFPEPATTKDELISQADLALFHAKNLGKDSIRFYQNVIEHIRRQISPDQQQLIGAFRTLLSTIAVKDKYTLAHSERVAGFAEAIGEAMDLGPKKISILRYAGILHDIGKIEIPKSILNKTSSLTEEEFRLIRLHPVYGENILEPLEDMGDLREIVRHHHERYDGKGYPDGLSGRSISIEARILCVADSFDAMLSDRPYAKRKTLAEACYELSRCAGSQFDPLIVEIFINQIQHQKVLSVPQNQKVVSS